MEQLKKLQILDGTRLKLLAMVLMLVDHIGMVLLPGHRWLRIVGRLAMPIFAFCVAEGFTHTRDRKRYCLRLALFGLLSEFPFDLALMGKAGWAHQNIMFTFLLAVGAMWSYELLRDRAPDAGLFAGLLREAADGILPYQDPETRMFCQLIDLKDMAGNYPETSGSAMVAYALLKGARLGMLDRGYADKGAEILEGIRRTYLTGEDIPVLHGICASAGLGPGPDNRTDRDRPPVCFQIISVFICPHGSHMGIQLQPDAVSHRIFTGGDAQLPGIDRSRSL